MESRLVWPAFFDEKMKRSKAMMKGKKKKAAGWDAGTSS